MKHSQVYMIQNFPINTHIIMSKTISITLNHDNISCNLLIHFKVSGYDTSNTALY